MYGPYDDDYKCGCNPALQVNLVDVIKSPQSSTDFAQSYRNTTQGIFDSLTIKTDACLPKPSIDSRVAAHGYHALAMQTFDPVEIAGTRRGLRYVCDGMGGFLMTGNVLRKPGFVETSNNFSYMDLGASGEIKGRGGVIPTVGTGSVPAHTSNGSRFRDNNFLGYGGVTPNTSLRVIAPS